MPPPPSDIKQPDKKLKARGLTVYISDIRNCTTREQEEDRVFQELANIRAKFAQKTKPLSSYDKRKYVWKLVYTYLLGYDVDFGHMQAIELLAGSTFSEKMCGYLAMSILLKGSDELMTLAINTIKRDLSFTSPDPVQCLALCAIANVGGRDMAHALADDVRRLAMNEALSLLARKKGILALLHIHRETPDAVRLPSELEVALLIEPRVATSSSNGLALCACALLRHMIGITNEKSKNERAEGNIDLDDEERREFEIRMKQRPQVQAIVVRKFHELAVGKLCSYDYFYHGTACPFLQVALLQVLREIQTPPSAPEIREPLFEALKSTLANVKWTKSSTMNNSSRCVAFEAIALIVCYGKDSKSEIVDASIDLLGRFAASKNANTRYLALGSMTNIARTVAERYPSLKEAANDRWQKSLSAQQDSIVATLKDPDLSVRKRAVDLLFHVCNEDNATSVIDELLKNLLSAEDLTSDLKQELVLRIAVLAERFAKNPKWYLDFIIRLLEAGDEHVGDDVWHRVAQIIANQEDIQQYASLRMYKALLTPGHVPVSLVKVAAYIIGEFGYMLTEYSTLEKGDLDHDVLPIDLFGACHHHFIMADVPTKIVLLSTYSKLLNIYEDLEVPVEEVFESQKKSINVEVQQRACEYSRLAHLKVETMNHVLEPMPPWPESHTLSKLEQQLEKMAKPSPSSHTDGGKTKVVVSPRLADSKSFSSPSSSGSPSTPKVERESYKRKQPETLLDLGDSESPTPPMPNPRSPSSLQLAQNRKWYLNSLLTPKSLLYDDGICQVGSHQSFTRGQGKIELFVGNLSSTQTLEQLYFETSNPNTDALVMVIPPGASRLDRFDVLPGAQVKFLFTFGCSKPFMASPEAIVIHAGSGHHVARVRFPITLANFLEPFNMPGPVFLDKWNQLESNPALSAFKVLQLDRCPDHQWPVAISKMCTIIRSTKNVPTGGLATDHVT